MLRLYLIAMATVALVVACDRVPLTSPTGSTISLVADRTVLPLNGQTTVRAVVTESSGTPVHNGTMVTFQSTIGFTQPAEAPTTNGVAVVTFFAGGVSGQGVINAYSGGARTGSGNASTSGVSVTIGSAAARSISVSATPPSVSQSGGTVTISALVMDGDSNPLPGVSVIFSAPSGVLASTSALTDSSGVARTTFTTTQTTRVAARAGTAAGDVEVTVSAAPTIQITAPDTGTVGIPVSITVTVTAGANNSSPRQVQSLTIEYGDGTSDTRTNVTGSAGFTHTYQQASGFTITARAVDVSGNTAIASDAIVISHAALPTVSLSVTPNPIPANVNGVASITVTAAAATNGPPLRSVIVRKADGTVIYSGTGGGTFTYQFQPIGTGATPITAVATDAAGATATTTTVVVVQ